MAQLTMQATRRKVHGKNANRRLRAQGLIPAVVYGRGQESVSLSVNPKEVIRMLYSESGRNTIFKLRVEESEQNVLVKTFQIDPIRGELLHADFQAVAMDAKMVFDVPVQITGVPEGVRVGGAVLDLVLRKIQLECLPGDLPDHIEVDVSGLQVGDSVRVADLQLADVQAEVLSEPDRVIVTVVLSHVEEIEEGMPESAVEPEILTRGQYAEEE